MRSAQGKMKAIVTGVAALTALSFSDPAPDVNIKDLDGTVHNLNTYVKQGKYVALDFVTLD